VRGKHTEPAEEGLSLFRGDRFDRQFHALADGLGRRASARLLDGQA